MNIQIPDYKKSRVLVVGDVMLDRYLFGQAKKISPEAPVPVIAYEEKTERLGGAANVAMNLAALGCDTKLLGVIGKDDDGEVVKSLLDQHGISHCLCSSVKPTITKTRVMSQNQQLLRIDNESDCYDVEGFLGVVKKEMALYEYIVFSDYNKGTLSSSKELLAYAKKHHKKVLVDPKGNDFSKYYDAFLLTPNTHEFNIVAGHFTSNNELFDKANQLIKQLSLDALLVTRSEEGMSLFYEGSDGSLRDKRCYAKSKEVFDVTGAGDTVIATLAASLAASCSLEMAVDLANIAAGIVVAKLGTASVTSKELEFALQETRAIKQGFIKETDLIKELNEARARGESIVMTNGCFDILHTGHVNYLEQASLLGDRLVVAINEDDSIRRLKGEDRPANRLLSRANVLAALRCVDWVVSFSEDTPTRIIKACRPDYLVKGGDNNPDEIPGAKEVKSYGGEVLVMTYVEGFSTTTTIERIKGQANR